MVAEFRWLYTAEGLAKRAAAEAGGAWPQITTFAVGDGGGVSHEPEDLLAGLINETWRGPVNRRYIHAIEENLVVVEALIPANQGGWTIREAGLIDEDDDLIAVGKYPATEKPAPGSGGEKDIYVRGGVRISNGGDLVVQIDASLVMATQGYVNAHSDLTTAHGSTSNSTADSIMQRDAAGRTKVAAPATADDVARKDTVDTHGDLTTAHGSTSAATAGAIMQRDGAGRAKVAAPATADDVARKDTVDTHGDLTTAHGSTSAATAGAIMQRDGAGRAKVAAPATADDVARKDTVDTHGGLTTAHGSTSAATAGAIMQRDGAGRAKVAAPAAADDIARKDTVDAHANQSSIHVSTASVGQAQLKTATGSVSATHTGEGGMSSLLTLPGGEYGFAPLSYRSGDNRNPETSYPHPHPFNTSYSATLMVSSYVASSYTETYYFQQRYVQSSPPYKIGDIGWGHFLYLLRNISTGEVVSTYEAQDPPWAYNGPDWLHKDDPELLALIPHPFADYHGKDPAGDGLEIVLVDLRGFDVSLWLYDNRGRGKSIGSHFREFAPLGKEKKIATVGIPEILGFTDRVKIVSRI